MNVKFMIAVAAACSATASQAEEALLRISGSTTVYPYAVMAADVYVEEKSAIYPEIEGIGSSKGIAKLCNGQVEPAIDIAMASRRIKEKELAACAEADIGPLLEVKFGFDGLVLATHSDINQLTSVQLFRALAPIVNDGSGLVQNSTTHWNQTDSTLPEVPISVILPDASHGTREIFDKKIMLDGCRKTGAFEQLLLKVEGNKKEAAKLCTRIRAAPFTTEPEGGSKAVWASLTGSQTAIGLVSFGIYSVNSDDVTAVSFNTEEPTIENIADGSYQLSRPLFFYLSDSSKISKPSVSKYVKTVLSDELSGENGFFTHFGLIPDPSLAQNRKDFEDGVGLGVNF
ncbi:MAG: substrate-binding domain-containing protein [Pseudomonadota bacterium]|nr:substrate-binding domain-containing protein [Pseudomonadota bacterium]MEC8294362.1 substrate-binding domain-containing protein [Pseudomonadota bacterium]